MSSPIISICIPVYNAEKYVAETLESAINQTYKNIEIIIVDDGSVDKSWEIIERYRNKYPHIIKAFKQENKGGCAARNKAFLESRGDFIQWLDADDVLESTKIEKQLKSINFNKDTDIVLSCSFGKFYNDRSKSIFNKNSLYKDLTPYEWLISYLTTGDFFYPHCWLINRKIIQKAGLWNETVLLNQDGEYFTRVVANSSFIKFVSEAIVYYRTGNLNSVSTKKTIAKISSLINTNILIVDNILEHFNDQNMKNACLIFLQRLYSNILLDDNELAEIEKLKNKIKSLKGTIPKKNFSKKYLVVKKILGDKIARKLKTHLWYSEIKLKKISDKIF